MRPEQGQPSSLCTFCACFLAPWGLVVCGKKIEVAINKAELDEHDLNLFIRCAGLRVEQCCQP